MKSHPIFSRLLTISMISGLVLLSFRFLFPLFFPFIIALLFVHILLPWIAFEQRHLHVPLWWARGFSFGLLWVLLFAIVYTLGKLVLKQCQSLMQHFDSYQKIISSSVLHTCRQVCFAIDKQLHLSCGSTIDFLSTQITPHWTQFTDSLVHSFGSISLSVLSGWAIVIYHIFVVFIATMMLLKDYPTIQKWYHNHPYYPVLHQVIDTMKITGLSYLRAQLIILLINWIVCSCSLLFIRNPYSILLGGFIAIFDAIPIAGSGMILVPWGIISILQKKAIPGVILLVTYGITFFVRQILEAKLIGEQINVLPFLTFASIIIGIKLYGFCGIVLGPLAIILIRSLCNVWFSQEQTHCSHD